MGLFGKFIRKRNRYSSYKGTVGKIARNEINRQFSADQSYKKVYTDVTEFRLNSGEKGILITSFRRIQRRDYCLCHLISTKPLRCQYGSLNGMYTVIKDGNIKMRHTNNF